MIRTMKAIATSVPSDDRARPSDRAVRSVAPAPDTTSSPSQTEFGGSILLAAAAISGKLGVISVLLRDQIRTVSDPRTTAGAAA